MMLEYFESLKSGLEERIKESKDKTNARKKFALEVAKLGTKLYSGKNHIVWCGAMAPFDLLNAMDVTSCFVEFVGAMLASTGTADTFMAEAEQNGYAADSCAYHRAVMGALLQGTMPVPDFIIGTSSPCVAGLAVVENMARKFKKDLFILNVPQEKSKGNVTYLANQIKDMVDFVSSHTGKPLDEDRLKESVEYTNQAMRIMIEAYDLAKNVPSPVNSGLLKNFGIVVALFMGTKAGVEICRAFRDEFKTTIEAGLSGIPDEKLRLMWVQNRIQFKHPIEKTLEEDFNATIVIDELNDITWDPIDPDDPFTSIAHRILSIPLSMSVQARVTNLQRLAKEYRVDGVINPCHWGCRQGTGARGMISQGLKKINVPVLNLEVDCADSRNFAEGQIKTRIEAFMEMLSTRP